MPGSKTNYGEAQVAAALLGGVALVVPATWYLAFSTAAYTDAADATALSEPVGNAYARVAIANNTTNFPAPAGDPTSVANAVAIVSPTATGNWGTIRSAYLCDAASGGHAWLGADLGADPASPTPITVVNGGSISIPISAFSVSED